MKKNIIFITGCLVTIVALFGWNFDRKAHYQPKSDDSITLNVYRARDLYDGTIQPVYLDTNTVYKPGDSIKVNDNHVIPAKSEAGDTNWHWVVIESESGNHVVFSRDQAEEQQ